MNARDAAQPKDATTPDGGRFSVPGGVAGAGPLARRAQVFDADDLRRAHTRIAHEIVERNHGADDVVLVGLYTRGVAVARRLADAIERFEGSSVPVGTLDVAFYRDDIGLRPVQPLGPTEVPVDIGGRVVVLVDDVLFTGRTDPRRARRAHRARPPPGGAARGARRPRPPRAADPGRLRRQEPADQGRARTSGCRLAEIDGVPTGRHRALGRRRRRWAAMKHLLSIDDLDRGRHRGRCSTCRTPSST